MGIEIERNAPNDGGAKDDSRISRKFPAVLATADDREQARCRGDVVQTACLIVASTLLLVYSLYFTRAITLPITVAVILNFVLSPLVQRLERLGIPNMVSAAVLMAILIGITVFGVIQLHAPAAKWIQEAPRTIPQIQWKLRSIQEPVREITEASEKVEEIAKGNETDDVVKVAVQQPSIASIVLTRTSAFAAATFLSATLLFFLLASGDRYLTKCVELMPTYQDKRRIVRTVRKVQDGIGHYLGTVTIINAILGLVIGTTLWFFDVPNAALWGVMAMLLNYVPFVGLIVGTGVVFLVSLVTFDTFGQAFVPALAYLVINAVEANIITPMILGRSMSMNPVAILLWMTLWGWMWGIMGAILAVPLLAIVKIACEEIDPLVPIAKFIAA